MNTASGFAVSYLLSHHIRMNKETGQKPDHEDCKRRHLPAAPDQAVFPVNARMRAGAMSALHPRLGEAHPACGG